MKTILVPTDFSKNANNALNYAIQLAKKLKAKLILFHAYNVTFVSPDMPLEFYSEQSNAVKMQATETLNQICRRVVTKSKVPCESIVREGSASDGLKAIVSRKRPQLIVMGTKGASGIQEVLIGSVAAKVAMEMTCPVIVVPEKATYDGIGQITFATDFHLGDIASLKKLTEFAKPFRSKIQVVHVSDPEYSDEADYMTKFKNKVLAKVDGKGIGFKYLEGDGSEKKLEKHLKSTSCALLAITTSDKTWMERLFFKNVSKKLIYHTRVPMIVFHNKS